MDNQSGGRASLRCGLASQSATGLVSHGLKSISRISLQSARTGVRVHGPWSGLEMKPTADKLSDSQSPSDQFATVDRRLTPGTSAPHGWQGFRFRAERGNDCTREARYEPAAGASACPRHHANSFPFQNRAVDIQFQLALFQQAPYSR